MRLGRKAAVELAEMTLPEFLLMQSEGERPNAWGEIPESMDWEEYAEKVAKPRERFWAALPEE